MLRLNQLNQYKDINLHFTQASKIGDRDTVQFEFAALLKPLEGPKNEVAEKFGDPKTSPLTNQITAEGPKTCQIKLD